MTAPPAPVPGKPLAGKRILTIDDNAAIRNMVVYIFNAEKARVEQARDMETGLEKLRAAQAAGQSMDLVFLDITLPGKPGDELLRIAREDAALRDLPIIVLTSSSSRAQFQKCSQHGINGYIVKPPSRERLLQEACNALHLSDPYQGAAPAPAPAPAAPGPQSATPARPAAPAPGSVPPDEWLAALARRLGRPNESLPALPAEVLEIRHLDASALVNSAQLAAALDRQPALAARVLKLATVLYQHEDLGDDLARAITQLGLVTISQLALCAALGVQLQQWDQPPGIPPQLWRHSVATGVIAPALYRLLRPPSGPPYSKLLLYTVGLAHDLGKAYFVGRHPARWVKARQLALQQGAQLVQAERHALGCDHAELGAQITQLWLLPPAVTAAARHHHAPAAAPEEFRELAMLAAAANYFDHRLFGDVYQSGAQEWPAAVEAYYGLAPADLAAVADKLHEKVNPTVTALTSVKPAARP